MIDVETGEDAGSCARAILDVVPTVMRDIRRELRKSAREMSVPQFRVLILVEKKSGVSLLDVADHIGLTRSSASTLVSGLEARGYVKSARLGSDRRRMALRLTKMGCRVLDEARETAKCGLAKRIEKLSAKDKARILDGMEALKTVMAGEEQN